MCAVTKRAAWRWLAGPILLVVALAGMSLAARVLGVSSPLFGVLAPSIAFAIAWAAWWPIYRPNIGFGQFAGLGLVSSIFVAAVRISLGW